MDPRSTPLLDAAQERLSEFGIALEVDAGESRNLTWHTGATGDVGIDAVATLTAQGASARYALVAKTAMTLTSIAHLPASAIPYPLLVVGSRISERSAAAFREADIQYVDALGNAYVKFSGVFVEVRGRTPSTLDSRPEHTRAKLTHSSLQEKAPPPRTSSNLFSPRRSQVALALLAWPRLAKAKIRDMARVAGVSTGQAHDALSMLEHAGFLRGTPPRLHRFPELLDYWTTAYPSGLGRKITLGTFYAESPETIRPLDPNQAIYFSGESAQGVDVVRPTTFTLYVDTFDKRMAVINRWRPLPDRAPNIIVRQKFWTDPAPSVWDNTRLPVDENTPAGQRNAPWPLVYADLLAFEDARLAEVAKTWRDHCVESSGL
ncbi:type IV toxin-antitoxin system AbiEi family antitoxin [Rhodococcus koreensis]|uniref:type IV toxin-antitoxin system AbiEi family antitoxin n=1 Tax=Rhodococcus koreensis TaxID=99653 RepID=UPI0019803656|nr:type IV toxin-antitoxin system AbiEi family antitoxin [Rhodococcus koreensis]QSE77694.1 hypothetical protein JWS14_00040 [Rhodococcus koreensis]